MYRNISDHEAYDIYRGVEYNGALVADLEPYRRVLKQSIEGSYVYRDEDFKKSSDFMRNLINIVTSVPLKDLDTITEHYLARAFTSRFDNHLLYMRTLLTPKDALDSDVDGYVGWFNMLFRTARMDKKYKERVPSCNNLDLVIDKIPFKSDDSKYDHFGSIGAACFYANQDKYDISVLEEFYNNIDYYIEHCEFNNATVRILDKDEDFVKSISPELLTALYVYIAKCFDDIKNNTQGPVIK